MRYVLALFLPLYVLDQLTKWWVSQRLPFGAEETIIPNFFTLVHWGNTGAAFSIMQGKSWFFIILATVALVVIAWMAWRGHFPDKFSRIAMAVLTAGILGNLTDRILHGHVIDFLLFDLHVKFANPWPAFNVADSCICIAAGLLIWQSFQGEKKDPSSPAKI